MIPIPSLQTDNLYKFSAIACLGAFFYCLFELSTTSKSIDEQRIALATELRNASIDLQNVNHKLFVDSILVEKSQDRTELKDVLTRVEASRDESVRLKKHVNELETKTNLLTAESARHKRFRWVLILGTMLSLVISIRGFWYWYKSQVAEDKTAKRVSPRLRKRWRQ